MDVQVLEGKLEAKGVSSKELAPLTIDSTTEWTYTRSHMPSPSRRSSRDSNASGTAAPTFAAPERNCHLYTLPFRNV